MKTIILFTRIDVNTLDYFKNFFPETELEQEDFTFLELSINEAMPRLIFVNDTRNCDLDNELLDDEKENYVYYHISSGNRKQHETYLKKLVPNCFEYRKTDSSEIGDHHNSDGHHFSYITRASQAFVDNKLEDYKTEIENLINESKK